MSVDAAGYTARDVVGAAMAARYGDAVPAAAISVLLANGGADRAVVPEATEEALRRARDAGWTCVIVTNGRTVQQEAKIRNTGLDRLVRGWVVSEAVGHKKPETYRPTRIAPDVATAVDLAVRADGVIGRRAW